MSYRYTFVDLANLIRDIDDNQLNFVGGWSGATKYYPRDVVIYKGIRYICLAASLNTPPPTTSVNNAHWSLLALVGNDTSSGGDQSQAAYNLASLAYVLAVTGTEIATAVQEQVLAVASLANQAELLAVTGTNLAKAAYDIAWAAMQYTGTAVGGDGPIAYEALGIAIQGTNLANQAYGLATYAIAIAGTNVGIVGDGPIAYEALGIAVQGTNIGTAAHDLAASAYGLATYAVSIAGTGAGPGGGSSVLEVQVFS